jgi:hypothetical protein
MVLSRDLTPEERRARHASKTLTPEQRTVRASNAGKAAQRPETLAKRLVSDWPAISEETRATIRQMLAPIVRSSS